MLPSFGNIIIRFDYRQPLKSGITIGIIIILLESYHLPIKIVITSISNKCWTQIAIRIKFLLIKKDRCIKDKAILMHAIVPFIYRKILENFISLGIHPLICYRFHINFRMLGISFFLNSLIFHPKERRILLVSIIILLRVVFTGFKGNMRFATQSFRALVTNTHLHVYSD